MKKEKKGSIVPHITCLVLLIGMIGLSLQGVLLSDDDPYNAMDHCGERSQKIYWHPLGEPYRIYDMHITEDEFKASMVVPAKRCENVYGGPYKAFLTPQNKHVQAIAEYLLGLASSEYEKALYALNFTQCAVVYSTDLETYGTREHFAYPIETLYIGKGDCEDKGFLLCSIMLAMGLDAVLIEKPQHVGVALHLTDMPMIVKNGIEYEGKTYYVCDSTESYPTRLFIESEGETVVEDPHSPTVSTLVRAYETMILSFRYSACWYLDKLDIERGALKPLLQILDSSP